MDQNEINDFINQQLAIYGQTVMQLLANKIQEKKLVLSGDLLQSLKADVLKASGENIAHLLISFHDAGRIRDMNNINYKKMPNVRAIEDFVRKVGLNAFSYIPYKASKKVPTESMMINRIAWGIAVSRHKVNKTKPKKWFARPFYQSLDGLIDALTTKYQQAAGQTITQSLNPTNTN